MKHQAIVGNIGHFDNEIDMAGLAKVPGIRKDNIKPQVDQWIFPDGHIVIVLSEGRLLNLGNATGHPSFVMSNSFSNQVLAQIELFTRHANYENKVYVLPKHLDEKIARVHVEALGAHLTTMSARAIRVRQRARRGAVQVRPLPLLRKQRASTSFKILDQKTSPQAELSFLGFRKAPRVCWRARPADHYQWQHHQHELVAPFGGAGVGQGLEQGVIDQADAVGKDHAVH